MNSSKIPQAAVRKAAKSLPLTHGQGIKFRCERDMRVNRPLLDKDHSYRHNMNQTFQQAKSDS
jgi:hypothetical protein